MSRATRRAVERRLRKQWREEYRREFEDETMHVPRARVVVAAVTLSGLLYWGAAQLGVWLGWWG